MPTQPDAGMFPADKIDGVKALNDDRTRLKRFIDASMEAGQVMVRVPSMNQMGKSLVPDLWGESIWIEWKEFGGKIIKLARDDALKQLSEIEERMKALGVQIESKEKADAPAT